LPVTLKLPTFNEKMYVSWKSLNYWHSANLVNSIWK